MEVSSTDAALIDAMSLEELIAYNSYIVKQIKSRRAVQARTMKLSLTVGTDVKFIDNSGAPVQGKIIKVMRKYAKVNTSNHIWRVPITMLELV